MTAKYRKHGLTYGFLLNIVFAYYNVECGQGKTGIVKNVLSMTTLKHNECVSRRGGEKSKFIISELVVTQNSLRE